MLLQLVFAVVGLLSFIQSTSSVFSSATLSVDYNTRSLDSSRYPFAGSKNFLRIIRLKGFMFKPDSIDKFSSLLRKNQNIQEVSIEEGNFNIFFMQRLPLKMLIKLKTLRIIDTQLSLFNINLLNFDVFPSSLERLELVLYENTPPVQFRTNLNLSQFSILQSLSLVGFTIDMHDWKILLKSIPFPERIKKLNLSNCSLESIDSFFTKSYDYQLKELHLGRNQIQINEGGFRNCLQRCTNLELLDLSNNDLVELDVFGSIFTKNSFPKMKRLLLTQENSVYFSSSNPMKWLGNLKNLKCFHMESQIGSEHLLSVEGFEFEELFLSPNFKVSNINFSKLKKLAMSSESFTEIEVNKFLTLQELKVYFYPNELNYKVVFDCLSKFNNLTSLAFVWMRDCDDELGVRIFDSFRYALDQLHLLKSISLKNEKEVKNCFPPILLANHMQLDSLELDICSLKNLCDWELQIANLCNLSSLSLNALYIIRNELMRHILFEKIHRFDNLKEFKFGTFLNNLIEISSAIDKMPNLVKLEIGEVIKTDINRFLSLSRPTNIRMLKIHQTDETNGNIDFLIYLFIQLFPKLNNIYLSNCKNGVALDYLLITLPMAELYPSISRNSNIPVNNDELFMMFKTFSSFSSKLYESFMLRNEAVLSFYDKNKISLIWEKVGTQYSNNINLIFKIIHNHSIGLNFDIFFKFIKIYNYFANTSFEERINELTYKKTLKLIFIKSCIKKNSIDKIRQNNLNEYPVTFYVKKVNEYFRGHSKIDSDSFKGFVEVVLIQYVVRKYYEDAEYFMQWIKQNYSIIDYISQYLQDNGLSVYMALSLVQLCSKETRDVQFWSYLSNYEPESRAICSLFKVFMRYFSSLSYEFVKAVIIDSMTEKDQQILGILFDGQQEKIDKFVEKMKEFTKECREINAGEKVSIPFALSAGEFFTYDYMKQRYNEFLDAPIEFEMCSICHLDDHSMNLNFKQFNGFEMKCGHKFHEKCMNRWLSTQTTDYSCPNCRSELERVQ